MDGPVCQMKSVGRDFFSLEGKITLKYHENFEKSDDLKKKKKKSFQTIF